MQRCTLQSGQETSWIANDCLFRFLLGYALGGFSVVLCPWIMEMLLPQQRIVLRGFFNWGWTRIILTATCYFFREWRTSVFVAALSAAPALFLVTFVIPESPTWLHSKGRTTQMIQSEKTMAKVAGVPYVPTQHQPIIHCKGIIETLRTRGLFEKISVLWFMWFVAGMSGYANDLNSNTITGDLYSNQLLFGVILVISKQLLLFADTTFENFKRRTLHQGAQLSVVVCFISLTFFITYNYHVRVLSFSPTSEDSGNRFSDSQFAGYSVHRVHLGCVLPMRYRVYGNILQVKCHRIMLPDGQSRESVGSRSDACQYTLATSSLCDSFHSRLLQLCDFVPLLGEYLQSKKNYKWMFQHETKNVNLDDVHIDDDEKSPEQVPMVTGSQK